MKRPKRFLIALFMLGLAPFCTAAQDLQFSIPLAVKPGGFCEQWTLLGLPVGDLRHPPGIVSDQDCTRHAEISGFYTGACTLLVTPGTYLFFARDLPRKAAFVVDEIGDVRPISQRDRNVLAGSANRLDVINSGQCTRQNGS